MTEIRFIFVENDYNFLLAKIKSPDITKIYKNLLQMLYTLPFSFFHSNVCRHGIETLPGHYTFPSRMDARRSRSCPWIVVTRDTMQSQLARKFQHGESHESRSKELRKIGKDSQ